MDVWLLFWVLMLGVGLGTAAAAWATRRHEVNPEWKGMSTATDGPGLLDLGSEATPADVATVRSQWEQLAGPKG